MPQDLPIIIPPTDVLEQRLQSIIKCLRSPIRVRRAAEAALERLRQLREEGACEAELFIQKADRTSVGYFQRKAVANTIASMAEPLQDAAVRIGEAPGLFDAIRRFRSSLDVSGGKGGPASSLTDKQEAAILDKIAVYKRWERTCPPVSASICVRVCRDEQTLYQLRQSDRMDERTVRFHLELALNEYCIAAGWGDQINGPVK